MADVYTRLGFDGFGWNISLGVSDYLSPMGATFGTGISIGGFQDSTHKTDSAMWTDLCYPYHIRNCKYISPTQVSKMGGSPVPLDPSNVLDTDCTLRWSYQDDTPINTSLSNVRLFAWDGSNPANAPNGAIVLAFERTDSQIYKDRVSDTPGDGGAWDSSKGIGGLANALICSNRTSSAIHYYYFGLSFSPTSKGQITCKLRFEFDAQ